MGSLLGDWPSYDPHNFSQLRPADPSAQPSVCEKVSTSRIVLAKNRRDYETGKKRWCKMESQLIIFFPLFILLAVISTEARNILLRHFYQKSEEKLRPKRAASDHLTSEHNCKQPRAAYADGAH
ncbi:unnamed protein product [Musa textilis]